MNVKFYLSQ